MGQLEDDSRKVLPVNIPLDKERTISSGQLVQLSHAAWLGAQSDTGRGGQHR